jgi:hypothetical protein
VCVIIIIIIKLPDQAIASTPSAPRPPPRGGSIVCAFWFKHDMASLKALLQRIEEDEQRER